LNTVNNRLDFLKFAIDADFGPARSPPFSDDVAMNYAKLAKRIANAFPVKDF